MFFIRSNADEKLVAALLTQLIGTKEQKRYFFGILFWGLVFVYA